MLILLNVCKICEDIALDVTTQDISVSRLEIQKQNVSIFRQYILRYRKSYWSHNKSIRLDYSASFQKY